MLQRVTGKVNVRSRSKNLMPASEQVYNIDRRDILVIQVLQKIPVVSSVHPGQVERKEEPPS